MYQINPGEHSKDVWFLLHHLFLLSMEGVLFQMSMAKKMELAVTSHPRQWLQFLPERPTLPKFSSQVWVVKDEFQVSMPRSQGLLPPPGLHSEGRGSLLSTH